jgi:hypothetical protein
MENREPYVEPTLEELGSVGDVTGGGIFDIGGIFDTIFGGRKPPKGSR